LFEIDVPVLNDIEKSKTKSLFVRFCAGKSLILIVWNLTIDWKSYQYPFKF